jgi:hypothetical protein
LPGLCAYQVAALAEQPAAVAKHVCITGKTQWMRWSGGFAHELRGHFLPAYSILRRENIYHPDVKLVLEACGGSLEIFR